MQLWTSCCILYALSTRAMLVSKLSRSEPKCLSRHVMTCNAVNRLRRLRPTLPAVEDIWLNNLRYASISLVEAVCLENKSYHRLLRNWISLPMNRDIYCILSSAIDPVWGFAHVPFLCQSRWKLLNSRWERRSWVGLASLSATQCLCRV